MTIIEFFDNIPIHNALSTLFLSPEKVILFGTDAKKMQAFSNCLTKVITSLHLPTRVEVAHIPDKTYLSVLKKLEEIVLKYPDCSFDLTGGETEILVAMGALSQKHGTPMHTVDLKKGTYTPLLEGKPQSALRSPKLSIGENIWLYGGKISESFIPPAKNDAFWEDVLTVWAVCRENPSAWNAAISALHTFCTPEMTYPRISLPLVSKRLSPPKKDMFLHTLRMLQRKGCLIGYKETENIISFRYKSNAVQTALSKEGTALELFTFYGASVFPSRKYGQNPFTDGAVGVVIDWDSAPTSFITDDVKNEIDVFLMQNLVPLFISCKNGYVDTDELYKLSVVAARFGGPYAKKCIVLSRHKPDASFMGRAKELNIRVIYDAQNLSPLALFEHIEKALNQKA